MSEEIIEQIESYSLNEKNRTKAQFAKVGVVGCGTTGQNIVRMIAEKGIDIVFLELDDELIKRGLDAISKQLDDRIDHWGMTKGEKRVILSHIKGTMHYEDFEGCDLVIEAVLSRKREFAVDVRKGIFKNIEKFVSPNAIIATNSSTLVITELSSDLKHKDRCVSLHFSTTTPGAKIIEFAKGLYTSKEVCDNIHKFVELIKQQVIPVAESPGLISPRIFVAFMNEACEVLLENVATLENIDLTMRISMGLQLGPFEMADKIGLDRILRWMDNLYNEFGEIKYKPSPILKRLVRANQLGRKTGIGFYKYLEGGKREPNDFNRSVSF